MEKQDFERTRRSSGLSEIADLADGKMPLFIKAATGRKAFDIVAMDVRELSSIADVFMICSGASNRQVSAIGEYIRMTLKKHGITPLSVEGMREGQWVLLDYGYVIIHIFFEETRLFYDLDGLWKDAKRIDIEEMVALAEGVENEQKRSISS